MEFNVSFGGSRTLKRWFGAGFGVVQGLLSAGVESQSQNNRQKQARSRESQKHPGTQTPQRKRKGLEGFVEVNMIHEGGVRANDPL